MSENRVVFGRLYYNGKYYNRMFLCTKKKLVNPYDKPPNIYRCEYEACELNSIGILPGTDGTIKHFGVEKADKDGTKYRPILAFHHGFSELNSAIEYDKSVGDFACYSNGRKVFDFNVPYYWLFTFTKGGTSFKVRGDGIFRFNDGTIVRINTTVVNEGVSLRRSIVRCPAGATEAIYVGTFSNIGTLRGSRLQISEEKKKFDVPFIDFSGCAIKSIQRIDQKQRNIYWKAQFSKRVTDHVPTVEEIIDGRAPGSPNSSNAGTLSYDMHKGIWNVLKQRAYVVSPNGKRERNELLDLYPKRWKFTPLPTFYQAFANSGIESIDDVIELIRVAQEAASKYEGALVNYQTSEFYNAHTFIMSTVEMFYGCKNLKSATLLQTPDGTRMYALDYGYMFAECSALETVEDDFWNRLIVHDKNNVRGNYERPAKFWVDPPVLFLQVRGMFKNCKALKDAHDSITRAIDGETKEIKIWDWITPIYRSAGNDSKGFVITSNGCFEGCTNLADYAEIPDWWKLPYGTKCYSETLYPGRETTT